MHGRGGGCCVARYAGGGCGAYDVSKVDQIMLKFRPIAPKPVTGGSASSENNISNEVYLKRGRGKRRYNSTNRRSSSSGSSRKKRGSASPEVVVVEEKTVVTLPLLPEMPDERKTTSLSSGPIWFNFDNLVTEEKEKEVSVVDRRRVVMAGQVGSCVTVECMTDTWLDEFGLGYTDEEMVRDLGWDSCPGFLSDEFNRVTWTNGAFKEMVGRGGGGGEGEGDMMVWLMMKERVPVNYRAFTCRVRVQYTCTNRRSSVMILPCDVWRTGGGGGGCYAWRLDVAAALSLGR